MNSKLEILCALLVLAVTPELLALDVLPDRGEVALGQSLLDLTTDRRVMCFAAHPDDEDLESLIYLRKALGVKTRTVFVTRGEGGQNEISPELDTALGVIRTAECEAAAAVSGSALSFLNFVDFGFSKSADEAFACWGREELELRFARVLWKWRPHVVITNHDETSGHGQHQVVGRTLVAIWDRLASAAAFPTLIAEGLEPWAPEALMMRVFEDEERADAELPVGDFDSRRGLTYAEMAQGALELHRSQGRWERDLGLAPRVTRYRHVRVNRPDYGTGLLGNRAPPWVPPGSVLEYTLPQVDWARSSAGDRTMISTYMGRSLDLSRMVAERLPTESARDIASDLALVERALIDSLGLRLEAVCLDPIVTATETLKVRLRYRLTGRVPITAPVFEIEMSTPGGYRFDQVIAPGDAEGRIGFGDHGELVLTGEPVAPLLTLPAERYLYRDFEVGPAAWVVAHFEVAAFETRVTARVPLHFDVAPSLEVLPPSGPVLALPGTSGQLAIGLLAHSQEAIAGTVTIAGLPGAPAELKLPFRVPGNEGRSAVLANWVIPAGASAGDAPVVLHVALDASPDEPVIPVQHTLRVIDAQVAGDPLVGVVYTYDDSLEAALDALHVRHARVSPETILAGDLGAFDTICLDLRAYLNRPDVVASNQRLLDYASAGGNLVVFYNKLFEWNPGPGAATGGGFGPFPLELSHARVTDETATVELLAPEHPLLSSPNRIGAADFDGWVQERGLYYPTTYDSRYAELLACHDPGEAALRGGLLAIRLGKGNYVYTSMGWYRQWRLGHAGSLRFLANLVSRGAPR